MHVYTHAPPPLRWGQLVPPAQVQGAGSVRRQVSTRPVVIKQTEATFGGRKPGLGRVFRTLTPSSPRGLTPEPRLSADSPEERSLAFTVT